MKQLDLSRIAEDLAFLEEADLVGLDWEKMDRDLARIQAEKEMEHMEIISNLDPRKTALFLGTDTKSECTNQEEQEYRKLIHEVFHKLLNMDITTILVENATIFGFFAVDELMRLRREYEFSLMIIHRKTYKFSWVHASNKEIAHDRHLQSIYYYALCDKLMGSLSHAEWIDICINHIAVAITERPPYYCNQNFMTAAQWNTLGRPDPQKTQELRERLLRDDEGMMLFAK